MRGGLIATAIVFKLDHLRQQGYRVVDVSAGTQTMQADRYANLRAEMRGRMREWLRTRGRIPPDEPGSELGPPIHRRPNFSFLHTLNVVKCVERRRLFREA